MSLPLCSPKRSAFRPLRPPLPAAPEVPARTAVSRSCGPSGSATEADCVTAYTLTNTPEAIDEVDAATGGYPAYYMINCVHPIHFTDLVAGGAPWLSRIGGLRTNASMKSHAELDESETLDIGDPADLARRYKRLLELMPSIRVIGGCCGTDHRHIGAVCDHCLVAAA